MSYFHRKEGPSGLDLHIFMSSLVTPPVATALLMAIDKVTKAIDTAANMYNNIAERLIFTV